MSTSRWVTGIGKRDHFSSYEGKAKRRPDKERKPFTPWLTVDIATGRVMEHRDIWKHERGTGA